MGTSWHQHIRMFCLMVLLSAVLPSLAQLPPAEIEAMEQRLAGMKQDTALASMLCKVASAYNISNPSKAILYGEKALALAVQFQHVQLEARAENILGISYGFVGSYELAATHFYQALRLREESGDPLLVASALSNVGVLHSRQGQYRQALALYRRADSLMARNHPQPDKHAVILGNIAFIYNKLNLPDSAILYAQMGYALNDSVQDLSTKYTPHTREAMARYLKGEYDQALALYQTIEQALGENADETDLNTLYRGMSDVYLARKNSARALAYAQKAHASALASTSKAEELMALEHLAHVYTETGNYKEALRYTVEVNKLKETLNSQQVKMHLQTLETHFDLTSQKRDNDRLQKANNRQYSLIVAALVMLALAVVSLLLLYRVNRLRKLALHEVSITNRSLEHVVAERTRELTRRNEQLISYAYLNSHEVRGPLARLMGLVYLLKQGWWGGTTEELVDLIDTSATELDTVIREINNNLHQDNHP